MALRHDALRVDSTEDEKSLVLAFQRGEDGAYQAVYDRYAERVERVCRRMLNNREDAKEATQETFLKAYQALSRFNGRYQLGAWFARIATNVCLDHVRAQARRPEDVGADPLGWDVAVSDADPEQLSIRRAEGRRVRETLATLPPMYRAAIVLRDLEGFSYNEVAESLDMSEPQVKALIYRARQSFKKAWKGTSVVGALLPARLLVHFRRFAAGRADHVARAGNGTLEAFQTQAASCSTVFQQCGQFLNERAAALMTAAVVTTAAGAAALGAGPLTATAPSVPARVHSQRSASYQPPRASSRTHRATGPSDGTAAEPRPTVSGAAAATPAPSPIASAATDPSQDDSETQTDPSGSRAPQDDPSPASSPSATASPTPTPLQPALGFASGDIEPRAASGMQSTVDCKVFLVDQSFRAPFAFQNVLYPAQVTLHVGGDFHLEVAVWPDFATVHYFG
ncbi:MAG: sigma-70 family RNA polymerase sigma factor, partial [Actinomycetota bacterium]|nr:sigma-70 family RNA polymerase sigma factor [Actinomycetota bacterium]